MRFPSSKYIKMRLRPSHLWADCLETGISSGLNTCIEYQLPLPYIGTALANQIDLIDGWLGDINTIFWQCSSSRSTKGQNYKLCMQRACSTKSVPIYFKFEKLLIP